MEYLINLCILFCIYGVLVFSLNLITGMVGLLSLGQIAFYGIGAYAMALGMTFWGLGFATSLFLGVAANITLAFIVGKILSRFQGDYYAIVTSGLAMITFGMFINEKEITSGVEGITKISRPEFWGLDFSSNYSFLELCAVFALLSWYICKEIEGSSFGRTLRAAREDEMLTRSMGYNTKHYKNVVFIISAVLSGIAGALLACFSSFVEPESFHLREGVFLFAVVVIGGLSSVKGSLLGTVILLTLPETLSFIGLSADVSAQIRQIIYGILLVLMMFLKPQGLFGNYRI